MGAEEIYAESYNVYYRSIVCHTRVELFVQCPHIELDLRVFLGKQKKENKGLYNSDIYRITFYMPSSYLSIPKAVHCVPLPPNNDSGTIGCMFRFISSCVRP